MGLMRVFLAIIMLMIASPIIGSDSGGAETGVSVGEESFEGFFLAVVDYYRVPQREVLIIRERGIPPYEIPVVLFIAKRAHVEPKFITDLRLWGNTWLDITLRFGLGPEIFYVPVEVMVIGSPYGKVYGYYKNKSKKEWKTIVLSDDDVVNLSNLKLMSEHYGYPPEKIIKMRSGGQKFGSINEEIRKEKEKIKEHRENEDRPKVGGPAY